MPTLVASSYDRHGKLQGNQLANVPIPETIGQNGFVSWQPETDYSVPCQLYGTELTDVEFFLTNELGDRVDEQNSQFAVTITLGWDDPVIPLGQAGAENDPADLRAVY